LVIVIAPPVAYVVGVILGDPADQTAPLLNVNAVALTESTSGAFEYMFISRLVPETFDNVVGGVKFAVYNAEPLMMRRPPMKPV
jgi:hypothetical protein